MKLDPLKLRLLLPSSKTPTQAALVQAVRNAQGCGANAAAVRVSQALAGRWPSWGTVLLIADCMGVEHTALCSEGAELAANTAELLRWQDAGCPVQPVLDGAALVAAVVSVDDVNKC